MKPTFKKLLASLGLLTWVRKAARKFYNLKYKRVKLWHLDYRVLNLKYHTADVYSKKWFYPRYDHGKIHEPIATDVFIDYIKDDATVLDIGGHLGYFSCIAGSLAQNGSVHVFEVDPKCLTYISKNLELNQLDHVHIHNYAVSDAAELIKIPKFDNPNPALNIKSNAAHYIEVESICIDDFLQENNIHPDFIKIDIEGAEWSALQGMRHTLESTSPTLLIEIHVDILDRIFHIHYKEIIKLLMECGYHLEEIEHRKGIGAMRMVDLDTPLQGNTMLLCTKKSN